MAVPGSPLDPRAQGCNLLIREGATLVQSAEDILEAIRPIDSRAVRAPGIGFGSGRPPDASDGERRTITELLGPVPVAVDELIRQSGLAPAVVQTVLLELELRGQAGAARGREGEPGMTGDRNARVARWIFLVAGIYGLIMLLPLYFAERVFADMGYPPLDRPEMLYGFVGAASVMQLLYLLIAADPARYRPAMLVGVLGKLSYGVPVLLLFAGGRIDALTFWLSMPDLVWAVLFAAAWRITRDAA
ncbi:MAG: hypothetical protein WDN24_10430 [Sphingomonas sp.]